MEKENTLQENTGNLMRSGMTKKTHATFIAAFRFGSREVTDKLQNSMNTVLPYS